MKKTVLFLFAFMCVTLAAASASAQTVVVNKYFNTGVSPSTGDVVELLVIQNNLDMRGMILKDFSSSMDNDGGGKYQFSNAALWASVPAGTLIVLRNNNTAADTTVGGGDFNLDVGLANTTYFSAVGTGTFDIAGTDMVMIKAAGSGDTGVTGSIHVLAGGTAGVQFNAAPTPKLRASSGSGTNQFVFANNSTQTLADFNGTGATGAATGLTFGAGNNANNTAYINSLRTVTPVSEPTVQASNVVFNNVNTTSLNVSWTNGNGANRLVLARAGSAVDAAPADGSGYAANASFGAGAQIGTGNFVVFSGSTNSVTVTNLSPNTVYHFAVFEFNGSGASADYLQTAPATGSQATAAAYTISGHVQGASGNLGGIIITLDGATEQTTTTDAAGNYSFPNLAAGGSYTVTPSSPNFTFTPESRTFANLSASQMADFTATALAPRVVISEFRFRGTDPDGAGALTAATNEFVELYNQTTTNVDISGWVLLRDNGTTLHTIPAGTSLAPRAHYLIAGTGYSLGAAAAPDASLAAGTDIPDGAGVALFTSSITFTADTRQDAVGFAGVANTLYLEGAGLSPAGGISTDGEYSFVRKLTSGSPQDTGDGEADFYFVATDAGNYSSRQSVLGAPGPEARASATQRNATIKASLIDPQCAGFGAPDSACARVRTANGANPTNAAFGTLLIRRKFTNTTTENLTGLRFRITGLTTAPAQGGTADLRALTSDDVVVTRTDGMTVPLRGLTLNTTPAQPVGGGINSTLTAGFVTLGQPLVAGESIAVEFRLGVMQNGAFSFFVNVEAPTPAPAASANEHLTMGNPSNATTDVNQPTNYLMEKPQYALSYHRDNGRPNWVSWHLDPTWLGSAPRQNDFRPDPSLPAGWYQVQSTDYSGSGFDRGHHTPSADRTSTVADNSATFFMTNMMPQAPDNNQGPWNFMEQDLRTLVSQGNELYIIMGGAGQGGTGSNGGVTQTVAGGKVTVPAQTWKVVLVQPQGTDDVARVTTSTRVIAVLMPNTQGIRNIDWRTYRVSVDQIEQLTGLDFFSNVPANIQAVIEAQVDNQSIAAPAVLSSLKERTTKTQTLRN
ncbi:MAG TPA: DNA/RNA non-specific endonuclease [Pyrinomonadaceae bacterium]|nr:DNA/RNA non-specific endonuclease [Pyrinomonadaceae bacterium]